MYSTNQLYSPNTIPSNLLPSIPSTSPVFLSSSFFPSPTPPFSSTLHDQMLPILDLEQPDLEGYDGDEAVNACLFFNPDPPILKDLNNTNYNTNNDNTNNTTTNYNTNNDNSYNTTTKNTTNNDNIINNSKISSILLDLESNVDINSWSFYHPSTWNNNNVLDFVFFVVSKLGTRLDSFRGEAFGNLDGQALQRMGVEDFVRRSPEMGKLIHQAFTHFCQNGTFVSSDSLFLTPTSSLIPTTVERLSCKEEIPVFSQSTPIFSDQTTSDPTELSFNIKNHNLQTFQPSSEVLQNQSNTWITSLCSQQLFSKQENPANKELHQQTHQPFHTKINLENDELYQNYDENILQTPCMKDNYSYSDSIKEEYDGLDTTPKQEPVSKAKRGRPRKSDDEELLGPKKDINIARSKVLWEFICDLLKSNAEEDKDLDVVNDEVPDMMLKKVYKKAKKSGSGVEWVERELGVFRIVDSRKVAEMWGRHKSNKSMSFEKLTRALRWCKKESKTMADLPANKEYPRRCYRFGPRASNWMELTR